MKILLDCVVTSAPGKCSSNIQFLTFVRQTLAARSDVFFYWLIPDWITQEDMDEVYPKHPNVQYFRIPQHKDRTKEYLTLSKELDQAAAFNGSLWDFDVILTMRSGLVPLLKMLMTSPRSYRKSWLKQIWLIEEMPLMEFKKTVLTFEPEVQDLFTLSGYLAAECVYVLSYHEPPYIVRRAKEFFTPSKVRQIAGKLHPVLTSQFSEFRLKTPDEFPNPETGKPFCIAHAGRMEQANRIREINDIMVKQFVMKGDKVKLLVCTVSSVVKEFDQSVIEVKHANRDEFWHLCKTEMDVILKMSTEGGNSLALIEPMMFGVPAIVAREPWAEGLLGESFPFYVDNETQAYALVSQFYQDYPTMYAKWSEWSANVFRPLMEQRFKEDLLYPLLEGNINAFSGVHARFKAGYPGKETNALIQDILSFVGDAKEMVFAEVIAGMVAAGKADKVMLDKLNADDRSERGLIWATDWNEYRKTLQVFHGWEDASPKVGHLRRV